MKVSCLKWNLFRFGSGTWITYLLNQHAPFFTVKDLHLVPPQQSKSLCVFLLGWNKKLFHGWGFAAHTHRFSLSDFLFSLTSGKINHLTGAACQTDLCFCCNFEAWRQIKGIDLGKNTFTLLTQYGFQKTGGQVIL